MGDRQLAGSGNLVGWAWASCPGWSVQLAGACNLVGELGFLYRVEWAASWSL